MDLKQEQLFVLTIAIIIGVLVYLVISPTFDRFSRAIEACSVYEGTVLCPVGYEPFWNEVRWECSKQPPLNEEEFKAMYGKVYLAHWLEFSEFGYDLSLFCLAQAEDEQRIIETYMQDKYEVHKSTQLSSTSNVIFFNISPFPS